MQTLQTIIITAVTIFLILTLLFFIGQRKLIFFPDHRRPSPSEAATAGLKEIHLLTADALHLLAWYKAPANDRPIVLYFHGNAGNIANRLPLARQFLAQNYGVLLVEYRGYGGNPGTPSEKGLYADAEAAFRFLQQETISPQRVVLYGESLGTAVAVEMATRYQVCAIILQAPFTSLFELARWHYPWVLLSPWDRFASIDKIHKLQSALLIAHGQRDTVVPFDQGYRLYQKATAPKHLLTYAALGHQNLWHEEYYQQLFAFINHHCLKA